MSMRVWCLWDDAELCLNRGLARITRIMCCRNCLLSEPGFSGLPDFQDWERSIHIPNRWGL